MRWLSYNSSCTGFLHNHTRVSHLFLLCTFSLLWNFALLLHLNIKETHRKKQEFKAKRNHYSSPETLEAWPRSFYGDPEYLHFQEAFDKVPDKKLVNQIVPGWGELCLMAEKCRAGVGWQLSGWLSANEEKLQAPYLEQVFEICQSGKLGKPLQPQRCTQPVIGSWLKRGLWRATETWEDGVRWQEGNRAVHSSGVTLLEAWVCWGACLAAIWRGDLSFSMPLVFRGQVV